MSYSTDGSGIQQSQRPSGSSGLPDKPQWGATAPSTPQTAAPSDSDESGKKHPDDVINKKKEAMWRVIQKFDKARSEIGADFDHTGSKSPAEKFATETEIGKEGKVWKSTLAETIKGSIADAIGGVTQWFNWSRQGCYEDWDAEPKWVSKDDSRGKW